jgi:hypothetical protein
VVVSPYIQRGTIINTLFDHTSVVATARKLFTKNPQTNALTKRDEQANSLDVCLNLDEPRTDTVKFPKASDPPHIAAMAMRSLGAGARRPRASAKPAPKPKAEPLSEFQRGMLQVALAMESKLPIKQHSGKSVSTIKTEHDLALFLEDVKKRTLKAAKAGANGKPGRGPAKKSPARTVKSKKGRKK